MSKVLRDISSIDTMPSHVEAPSRIFGRTVGKTPFRSGLATQDRDRLNLRLGSSNFMENLPNRRLQPSPAQGSAVPLQNRLNQDLRLGTLVQRSAMNGTFGLRARNLTSSQTQNGLNHEDISGVHHKSSMSTVSRTFGLISEDGNSVNTRRNEISNLDLRKTESVNSSFIPRNLTFGLQTRNLTMHSRFFPENDLRENPDMDFMSYKRSNVSTVSRTFDLRGEKVGNGGLSAHGNEGVIQDLRRNGNVNSSLTARPFGHQLRNLTLHSSVFAEGNPNSKMSSMSSAYESFRPGVRNSTLIGESRVQERGTCNEGGIDNEVFRKPTLSRVIRGRDSLLSSRLFHSQNMDRHCRDLSNINGFNVSHISRRDMDSLSESRMALNVRSKWMDNQSTTGSVFSTASVKSQFMNLLENLHHSILKIGPHVTAEAVRMEFDKAKQGLEDLCEMSIAFSIREAEADAASVISRSSKYTCPPVNESGTDMVIDGGSSHLKSSKEVRKTLISNRGSNRRKFNLSIRAKEGAKGKVALMDSSKDSDDEEVSGFLFKKPKQVVQKRKVSKSVKIKASKAAKSPAKEASKVLSLKQWYPVVLGSDLALCGLNEEGVAVKTDPVKKRLNSRRVELVSGLVCNLIGSPSSMVSALPKKLTGFLKNGLTERWRVLREELANCQTAEKRCTSRKSGSPKVSRSPKKAAVAKGAKTVEKKATKTKRSSPKVVCEPKKMKSPKAKKKKSKSPRVSVSPKKGGKVAEVLTRSGRAVKPPSMFWIVGGNHEVSSSQTSETPTTTLRGGYAKKQYKRINEGTPKRGKAAVASPKKQLEKDAEFSSLAASPSKRFSQVKSKKTEEKSPRGKAKGKSSKVKTSRRNQKKEDEEENRVHSSTEDAKRQIRTNKRKREVSGDVDAVEAKKSKLEKIIEVEVESTVEDTKEVTKKGKKKKGVLALSGQLAKVKAKKSPAKKTTKTSKKKTQKETESENRKEEKDANEFEEDFELQLDDIEIPEIANVSGNPQLSRSQLRVVSMETPPLKYFNNLRLLRSATPLRSPDWCISQRTESEVKRFQKRREEAFKKKTRVDVQQTIVTQKATKTVQSKELKRVMEWISEKTVKSPTWNSKVVQYLLPSRKQLEEEDDEEEGEREAGEMEFLKPSFG